MRWPNNRSGCREGNLFVDEHGVTTTGMVLSLLITLSLVFTAMQVYRIESASAEVQDVADAVVLAAESQVAEFMLIARFCDATVLSLSLTGIAVTGLGIAALCTPATAAVSTKLIEAGERVIKARNAFSKNATKALNKLQMALPYFSAACGAAVAAANNSTSPDAQYLGVAILVPTKGERLEALDAEEAEKLADEAAEEQEEIREEAKEAEEAAEKANACKQRAFMRDCGDNPNYCMYDRASKLARLSGGSNPLYHSVDTWSFSVALERAKAYYQMRREIEAPEDSSAGAQARSALRYRFYSYAVEQMNKGYVEESSDFFSAYFPLLPKTSDEVRGTSLYTEKAYLLTERVEEKVVRIEAPVDGGEGEEGEGGEPYEVKEIETHRYLHSYDGCPGATGEHLGHESLQYMESNGLEICPECNLSVLRMSQVDALTSINPSGFEYHYRQVAEEAKDYERELKEAQKSKKEVKSSVNDLLSQLKKALKETVRARIEPAPPGRFGAVSFVVNSGVAKPAGALTDAFVAFSGTLGPRAAISASTLVEERSDEGRTVVNSLLDGLREDGGVFVGAMGILLDIWSWMLKAYGDGQDAISSGIEDGLNSLPLVGPSGLGTWVSDKLKAVIEGVGLQPVKTAALKPVVVNSAHVLAKGDTAFSSGLLKVKQRLAAHPHSATDLFSAFLTDAEKAALSQVKDLGDTIEIASIELFGESGPSIPITIPIPSAIQAHGVSMVQDIFEWLRTQHVETMEVKPWE